MYQWSKLAALRWLNVHEDSLRSQARGKLVIVSRPGRKRVRLEVTGASRKLTQKLFGEFGGRVVKWPRNWLKRFENLQKSEPLKIGSRLLVSRTPPSRAKRRSVCATDHRTKGHSSSARLAIARSARLDACQPLRLVIPASAAFGTGEHATTAMSLRLLERLSRKWEKGWSFADLGTGSGILALAAKRFGAGRVIGVDIDPKAISVAKSNARLNEIDTVNFQLGDVRRWKPRAGWDVVAANLYSELVIEILPKLKRTSWLILSGVLDRQANELFRVLHRNNVKIATVKRCGKWTAVLAACKTYG